MIGRHKGLIALLALAIGLAAVVWWAVPESPPVTMVMLSPPCRR